MLRIYPHILLAAVLAAAMLPSATGQTNPAMNQVKLIVCDPGHFHAGLIQNTMLPGVSPRVHIYAPLGPDLAEHIARIARYNVRPVDPTTWEVEVHASPDFLERMLREHNGNVVIFSGNRGRIDRVRSVIDAGMNALVDKPWIIRSADVDKVAGILDKADRTGLVAYDIMTERYEITNILQRILVNDPPTFGSMVPGTPEEPGVYMESVHHLLKLVSGVPNLRPAWFFDVNQQGEGLSDVGTHLVDLIQWTLYPEQSLDYRKDVKMISGKHWPTELDQAQFARVTNVAQFPAYLAPVIKDGKLQYFCNNQVVYALRGVNVKLDVLWRYEAPPGGNDTLIAYYRGTRSRVEIRQGKEQNFRPEVYVVPNDASSKDAVLAAVRKKLDAIGSQYPGLGVEDRGKDLLLTIPDRFRIGHEAHFAQVATKFFGYLKNPKSMPAWEKPDMLAKYYVCTKGVEMSR